MVSLVSVIISGYQSPEAVKTSSENVDDLFRFEKNKPSQPHAIYKTPDD
jgi:hypothetical protein